MQQIRRGIIVLLLLKSTLLLGQDIRLTEKVAKLVLNDLSELDRRRKESVLDSMTISALNHAYYYKDSALQASRKALEQSDRIAQDFHATSNIKDKELGQAKKEIRKQKFLKWCGFGLAAIIGIASLK